MLTSEVTSPTRSIATVIVTYHPDMELLRQNIGAIHPHVDKILIWRNSADDLSSLTSLFPKIEMIGDGTNHFMAYPLNQALQWAHNHGYDWLLTMDQDSKWDNFEAFIDDAARNMIETRDTIALYAPVINRLRLDSETPFRDIEWTIQSGMLTNVKKCLQFGGFREDYKIYGVDEEFCYWVNHNNMKVRVLPGHNLTQKYGNARKSRWGFTVYNYSPTVRYFLIRNMIWMKREFPRSTTTRRILSVVFHNTRDIILSEKHKFPKLSQFYKGIFHGLTGKYVKRPKPE